MQQQKSNFETTLTPRAGDGSVRVVQFTDLHLHDNPGETLLGMNTDVSFAAVMQLAKNANWPPDFVLVTGDMVHSGSIAGYKKLYRELDKLQTPTFCLPGNHDVPVNMRQVLNQGSVSTPRQVKIGKWNIILLDSTIAGCEAGRLSKNELAYLQSCLEADPKAFHLVALHHPPYEIGSSWLDQMALENPEDLFEILDRFPGTRCVLNGHVHQTFESQRAGIELISSPSTCVQFKPKSEDFAVDTQTPAYRWLQLNENGSIETGLESLQELPAEIDIAASGY